MHKWYGILQELITAEYGEPETEAEREAFHDAAEATCEYFEDMGYTDNDMETRDNVHVRMYETYLFARWMTRRKRLWFE